MADRGSYPHPVLDDSDDVKGEFRFTSARVSPSAQHVDLDFTILLDNPELHRMLDAGDLALRARWRCSATMSAGGLDLRVQPQGEHLLRCSASIDQDEIDGRVDVTVLLVSERVRDDYHLDAQNEDYGASRFSLSRGHVVADDGTFAFDAKKSFDPMRRPLESCFEFQRKSTNRRFVEVDTSGVDSVIVEIPPEQFDQFAQQSAIPEVQIAAVVLPALMQAVVDLDESIGDESGGWRATLQRLIEDKNLAGKGPLVAAQSILDDPIALGLRRLDLMMTVSEEE